MKEVKDLVCLEDSLNKKGKDKDSGGVFKDGRDEGKEIGERQDVDIEEKKEDIDEESVDKKEERGGKIFMKYRDGKVRYVNKEDESFLEKIKLKFTKRKERSSKDADSNEDGESNKSSGGGDLFNRVLIIFLVVSLVFIYVYYIRDSSSGEDVNTGSEVESQLGEEGHDSSDYIDIVDEGEGDEGKKEVGEEDKYIRSEMKKDLENEIEISIYTLYRSDKNKIDDYIDLKANMGSVISHLKKNKSIKEDIYSKLIENKHLFDGDEIAYRDVEKEVIRSIAMSEELIGTFDKSSIRLRLESIIEKYNTL